MVNSISFCGHYHNRLCVEFVPPPARREWWEIVFPLRPRARLIYPLAYTDPEGFLWESKTGSETDGGSSPWFWWRFIPPFSRREVRAYALHDAACQARVRPSWQVHAMIYWAARCDGVHPFRAWCIWFGVRFFGPRFPGNLRAALGFPEKGT